MHTDRYMTKYCIAECYCPYAIESKDNILNLKDCTTNLHYIHNLEFNAYWQQLRNKENPIDKKTSEIKRKELLSIYFTKSLSCLNSTFLMNPKFLSKLLKHNKGKVGGYNAVHTGL